MTFQPASEKHAITEVVFGIQFVRPFSTAEIQQLIDAHHQFQERLPRVNKLKVLQLAFGDIPPPPGLALSPPPLGVMFDEIKRDGSLAWRLRADDNAIFVNCLTYTHWTDIWPKALKLLQECASLIATPDNHVQAMILQYVDAFRWVGKMDDYDASKLFDPNSANVASSIFKAGPYWHLHQGWFRATSEPLVGRVLERTHIDSASDDRGVIVKVDAYLQLELSETRECTQLFASADQPGQMAFETLHDRNKSLLKSFLAPEMSKRIGLG